MDQKTEVMIDMLDRAYRHLQAIRVERLHIGICACLSAASDRMQREIGEDVAVVVREAHADLYSYLSGTLAVFIFYHDWVLKTEPIALGLPVTYTKFRHGRLAWIDAMIAALRDGRELPATPSLPSDYKPRPPSAPEQNFYRI